MDSFDILDNFFEPVLIADQNEKIIYYNPSFLNLFRMTPRLMKKNLDMKEYLTSVVPEFLQFYSKLMKESQAISTELSFVLEGQACTVIIKGERRESGDIILLFKDVTVEKLLNDKYRSQLEELKNTHAQIVQSDKLIVIGEMTANISHEINNPLTVAIGNAELIDFSLENDDLNKEKSAIKKFNENIGHSLQRINLIISNMKEFLHKSEDKKEYCDAKEVVDMAIAFTNPSLKGGLIDLKVEFEGKSPMLLVNKVKIEQVLVNLIQNAIDSLKESNIKDPSIHINVKTEENGNFILISVKDNGAGVSSDNRSKIFETFFTTKEIGRGTGLGLSISNRIIQSHQGKLELLNSKTGANFRITLPSIGVAGYTSGNWEKLINNSDKLIKVLVVDNEVNILNLCMNFLSDSEYHFLGASAPEEAFKELERTSVNLIVTDMKMPTMDGENFIRELRTKNINVPVLFMSSKDFIDKYKLLKIELDLKGVILKPFTREELVGAIGMAINDK